MAVQLFLDEGVDPLFAQVLRNRGINRLSTQKSNNYGKSDAEQLAFAARQQRAFLTSTSKTLSGSHKTKSQAEEPIRESSSPNIFLFENSWAHPASRTKTWP